MGPRQTSGLVNTSFTVAPYEAHYWLLIACPGYEPQKLLVRYGEDVTPLIPLDLKEIVMKKERPGE